jgi:glycosyltransferase involved in cell wall biosynthesis
MKKLAIITSHPIQYNAPLFQLLSKRARIKIKVFYTWGQTKDGPVYDPTFGKSFNWDIPLLEGYEYEFIENTSKNPGTRHFNGIINKTLIHSVLSWKPDAVMVYGWSFRSHLQAIRFFKGKLPVLFRGDSTLLDDKRGFSVKKIIRRLFLKWVYQHVDLCLYTGTENKKYFEYNGLQKEQLIHAPHAIDNDRFSSDIELNETNAKVWRRKLGIADDDFTFLFAGKLEYKKAPDLLIKAFKKLHNPDAKLIICGAGEMEQKLRELAENRSDIIFISFQNQQIMPVVYRLGNVFILPSRGPSETWGLSMNEAMACGRPVIASNKCGGAIDLIDEGKSGYMFQSGLIDHLADTMRKAMTNNEYNGMSKYSVGKIQEFSLISNSIHIENLMKQIKLTAS